MKNLKTAMLYKISTVFCLLCVAFASAQSSYKERFNVGEDVLVSVNTSHTNVVIETWNKDVVEVEAFIDDEKLSESEKEIVFKKWKLDVLGNSKKVIITSNDGSLWGGIESMGSLKALERLDTLEELGNLDALKALGDMPLLNNLKEMDWNIVVPDIPEHDKFPNWPFTKERPSIKEKDGYMNYNFNNNGSVDFNSEKYRRDKEGYVAKLNKKYGSSVSVREVDNWLDDVDDWAEDFEKVMEDWGEKFGEEFGEKFGKDMEEWGEKFGKDMEQWGEEFGEKFGKSMEQWGEEFGEDMEKWAEQLERDAEKWAEQFEENGNNYSKRVTTDENGNKAIIISTDGKGLFNESVKAKKTIIIRMPKGSRTDINVRHGEVKMADAYNLKANLDYSSLLANSIDGGETLINVAYAPVSVNVWKDGALELKYVEKCKLNSVGKINLQANSSNVNINDLNSEAFLSGSFGNLFIQNIAPSFKTVDIVLENTDASIQLPDTAFTFMYNGKRSRFESPSVLEITSKNKNTSHSILRGYRKSSDTNKSLTINASYSNVNLSN